VDVNAVNSLNETGLFVAVAGRHRNCVGIILGAYPPPEKNKAGVGGATALHVASSMGNVDILNDLLAEGAEVCVLDAVDRTPLHAVVGSNQSLFDANRLDCLLLLLDQGGEVVIDIQDTLGGDTALMLAVRAGWVDGVRELLQTAADCRVRNYAGYDVMGLCGVLAVGQEMAELVREYYGDGVGVGPAPSPRPQSPQQLSPQQSPSAASPWRQSPGGASVQQSPKGSSKGWLQ
jgi:hypothetical protein